MSILRKCKTKLGNFAKEEGSVTIEFMLILPILLWAIIATYSFFDVYKSRNLAIKANYAVSDLLSRETARIDMDYLRGIEDIFEYLTQSGDESWLRVTEVKCRRHCSNPATRELRRTHSHATDGVDRLTHANIDTDYRDVIPLMLRGDRLIMVETMLPYEPPFNTYFSGVTARHMTDVTLTRSRFGAGQLCWIGRRCGNDDVL